MSLYTAAGVVYSKIIEYFHLILYADATAGVGYGDFN
jgi:hypothetical protein